MSPESKYVASLYFAGFISTQKVAWQVFSVGMYDTGVAPSTIVFGSNSTAAGLYEGTLVKHATVKDADTWSLTYTGMYFGD
jgi:hypothetical protein